MFGLFSRAIVGLVLLAALPALAVRLIPPPNRSIPPATVSVSDLLHAPGGTYSGRLVQLSGQVHESISTPFGGYWLLSDQTGSVPVAAPFSAPPTGSLVLVRGSAATLLSIGDWLKIGPVLVLDEPPVVQPPLPRAAAAGPIGGSAP